MTPTTPPEELLPFDDVAYQGLRQIYLGNCLGVAQSLKRALNAAHGDQELVRMAHRLSGTGASFGFPEITSLARKLHRSCREGLEPSALEAMVQALCTSIYRAHRQYGTCDLEVSQRPRFLMGAHK